MGKVQFLAFAGVAVLASIGTGVAAVVDVSFDRPEQFTDVGSGGAYGGNARTTTLDEIRQHLKRLGDSYLRPNQTLKLDILDIDLAGRHEPWRTTAYDVRFMRDVTRPRIKLRYSLEQDGRVVREARETVVDMNYLDRADARLAGDPLRYEKAMLNEWFKARFAEGRLPPH